MEALTIKLTTQPAKRNSENTHTFLRIPETSNGWLDQPDKSNDTKGLSARRAPSRHSLYTLPVNKVIVCGGLILTKKKFPTSNSIRQTHLGIVVPLLGTADVVHEDLPVAIAAIGLFIPVVT